VRFAKKIPQTDQGLSASLIADGWFRIREAPNIIVAFFFSVPFMFINSLISYLVITQSDKEVASVIRDLFVTGSWTLTIRIDYIIYIYIVIVLHEIVHLLFVPNFYKSDKTYFGIKLWGGFVFTTERISKGRFVIITLAPFLLMSVILPFILGQANMLNGFIVFLIFLNALSSSVDMLNTFLVAIQVPNGSMIINNGFESYYKKV